MKTRKNNKGFSLVELIVVVAIMAVLVGILAPAYLKYVENSRINKDKTNAEEFRHAVEVALSDETVYNSLTLTNNITITINDTNDGTFTAASGDKLQEEMVKIAGNKLNFTSNEHNVDKLVITVDKTTLKVTSEIQN